jgi:hypothetical protein
MAFAGSNLKLSDVTSAYGVSSLLNMRGKTSYGSSSDPTTGTQVGNANVNLSLFFNRFITSSGTMSNQSKGGNSFGGGGYGINGNVNINNFNYTMMKGVLTSLSFNYNVTFGTQAPSGISNNGSSSGFELTVTVDGSGIPNPNGVSANVDETYSLNGSNTLSIYGKATLRDSYSNGGDVFYTYQYTIGPNGLTLTN